MRRLPSALFSSSSHSTFVLATVIAFVMVVASPILAQQKPVLVTQPVDNSVRTTFVGNVHPLARAQYDQGEVPVNLMLHRLMLVLKRSDQQEAVLRSLIENQQNRNSSSYHQWLTPVQVGAQFGPSDSDIAAVTNWLQQSGFQLSAVSNGRTVIEFSGTAGQVKQAFGTALHKYVVNGEEHIANSSEPSIPRALAPVVAGVNSLHNFFKKAQNAYAGKYSPKTHQLTAASPDFTFSGCGGTCYAVTPFDFATIYDLLPLWNGTPAINGTGQTIAIVGRTAINPSDAPTFWGLFGLGKNGVPIPTLTITNNGPAPGFTGDEAEADIDTQWSGAAAPGATINYVTSESTETEDGVDLSAFYIVDNNIAPIMSESYGSCEAAIGTNGVQFYGALWEQAAVQGITAMVSTGDNGAAGCDNPNSEAFAVNGLGVNGLGSTPFNIAVGGTDFNQYQKWTTYWKPATQNNGVTQESAVGPIPETTWNDSCTNLLLQFLPGGSTNPETNCNNPNFSNYLDISAGSGGASIAWMKPTWQKGAGVPPDTARDLPDVSLFASNGFLDSFYLICQSDASQSGSCDITNPSTDLQGYGGTSVASPAFAGIMALVDQKTGSAQGNANFVLYTLASNQPTAFHDVPSGSTNAVPCQKGSPNCVTNVGTDTYGILSGESTTANYDLATGLGSVDANVLATKWNTVTFTPTTTTLTITPSTLTHGTAATVKIGVTSNKATGDVAILMNPGTPGNPGIDWYTLASGVVNSTTNLLPGGSYKVIAHYEGDSTYGGSYSTPTGTITVSPEPSTVFMGSPAGLITPGGYVTTVVYGTGAFDQYLLRADVYSVANGQCTTSTLGEVACPTGTMTFTDNGNPLDGGAFKLNSFGYAEDQAVQLTGGSHSIVASYGGDPSYNSSQTTATVTVTPATTSISNVGTNVSSVAAGAQFNVSATVAATASFGVAPTGTVSFFANGTKLLGTVQLTPVNGDINTGSTAALNASLTTSISTGGTYTITATYTTGDGNYSSQSTSNSVQLTVTGSSGSFTLSAAPASVTVPQGGTGTSMITVTSMNGFNAATALTASGLPSGVTAAFNPTPVTPPANGTVTSVLTFTASATATAGTATVTITGTSGTTTATTTVSLTITAVPNFTIAANPTSLTIVQGNAGGTSVITVTPLNGFSGNVTMAASGLPSGVTAAFNPNPTATTSTLTLTASASATVGIATVTITGTSGALTATTTVALTVAQNFTLPGTLTNPASVEPGQSTTTTMAIAPSGGGTFTSNVTYTCSAGLPAGTTCSFNPTQINSGATGAQTVMIKLQTSGPFLPGAAKRATASPHQRPWLPLSLPLAGIMLVGLFGKRVPRLYQILGLCTVLAFAGFLVACGSSSPAPSVVTVSPGSVSTLYPSLAGAPAQTQQFSASVSNSTSQTVTWAVTGGGANGTIDQTGLYTAPVILPNPNNAITVTATSTATTTPGSATVNLKTPSAAGTFPITVTVTEGNVNHTTTFNLTVL